MAEKMINMKNLLRAIIIPEVLYKKTRKIESTDMDKIINTEDNVQIETIINFESIKRPESNFPYILYMYLILV